MIDSEGYRPNVGIILSNNQGRLFWARRLGQNAWQFPQGGIDEDETAEEAMYRELYEEIGLKPNHVKVISCTKEWLRYRLPDRYVRYQSQPLCIGQKQIWYMLKMVGCDYDVQLNHCDKPEFDHWRWVNYWHPLKEVVQFKRKVYSCALNEFAEHIPQSNHRRGGRNAHQCRRTRWLRMR